MPQPIDPTTEIARVSAAERIQQIAGRASLALQMREAADAARAQVALETQVEKPDPKGSEVDRESKHDAASQKRRKKREGRAADPKKTPTSARVIYTHDEHTAIVGEDSGGSLDVKI